MPLDITCCEFETLLKYDHFCPTLQVHFTHGEQSFSLSTAPESDQRGGYRRSYRAPKQVVMGLQKPLTVERDEKLLGIITLTPDFTQHRSSLALQLNTSFSGSKSVESEKREYLL